eukprot:c33433_g1_i1.p1 GENE.c33433_g1_i1~~c33433_g1_i1.p1  ORF type:complete len:310 (+),score=41.99 c33433_g1_i1:127-930(+)
MNQVLTPLTRAHVLAVPFENLNPATAQPVGIDLTSIFNKIVVDGRGGYCWETNGLMNCALRALGFTTRLVICRVLLRPEPSGLTHIVNIVTDSEGQQYLIDVGCGGFSPREPIPLSTEPSTPHNCNPELYRLITDHSGHLFAPGALILQTWDHGSQGWQSCYSFHLNMPVLDRDLILGNHYTSTFIGPENRFTRSRFVSLCTPVGRKTAIGKRFREVDNTQGGVEVTRIEAQTEVEYRQLLIDWFGIVLGDGVEFRQIVHQCEAEEG